MRYKSLPGNLPTYRFPVEPWRLVEVEPPGDDLGLTETLFAVGNGYFGFRANPPEGRVAHAHGTYINGFHETWPIRHAEAAHAFAKTGQTIVNAPDAKLLKLYVDDEPLLLEEADLVDYERSLDFRTGVLERKLVWQTPAGKRIRVTTTTMISVVYRHLAVLQMELELLDHSAPLTISSQLQNRQDGVDEYHVTDAALGEGLDPRQASGFDRRVLEPRLGHETERGAILGYRCMESKMTLAAGYRHHLECNSEWSVETTVEPDLAKSVFDIDGQPGSVVRLTKYVAYHSSRGVPTEELAERCTRTLDRAAAVSLETLVEEQRTRFDEFWHTSDIKVEGSAADQQALRWNLFQLGQATLCTHEQGVAAKGVTAGGYDGHYFWDTEVYVVPFLAATNPSAARKLLRFRWWMLDAARRRASEMSQDGALYPWRTINGEEASAYYAAGTAQYHINAAVAQAIERYVRASEDYDFLAREGAEILVETARMWEDLGFYSSNGSSRFHIHRVTGPDEYTTVVNDNLYTNVMASFNMRYAAATVRWLKATGSRSSDFESLMRRTNLELDEVDRWEKAARSMHLPFDERLGINPQDEVFLELEPWNFEGTPPEQYPLLLHFHPLVIYRHQVLKQADVVLAMYLQGDQFDLEQKRRNFTYYDPITTGDSSLSSCVQSIVASEVGEVERAWLYFQHSLYLDLCDTHGNTVDGVHIANAAGAWAAVVSGFAGMRESVDGISFRPRLPEQWQSYSFRLCRGESVLEVEVSASGASVSLVSGRSTTIVVEGEIVTITGDSEVHLGIT